MPFNEQLPEWQNEGTQPPASKRVEGWQPSEKPPASWFNWLLHRTYKALQELQQKALHRDDVTASDISTEDESNVQAKLDEYSTQIQTAQQTAEDAATAAGNAEQNAKDYTDQEVDIVSQQIENHASNKNNPHNVTKSQVGLGNVQNYSIATQAEAETGTSSTKYMTPQRTKQAIDSLSPVKSVNNKTGNVNLTAEDVSAETPAGAQAKADAAEAAAKQYTDQEVGAVSQIVNEHLADGVHQNIEVTNANDATSVTDAPLKTAGGLAVAKNAYVGREIISENNGLIMQRGHSHFIYHFDEKTQGIALQSGKRIRLRFKIDRGIQILLYVKFVGSLTTSSANRTMVIDKIITCALTYDNLLRDVQSNVNLAHNISDEEVYVEETGNHGEIDLIINHTSEHSYDISAWALTIELLGTRFGSELVSFNIEDMVQN